MADDHDITALLARCRAGDSEAHERLAERIYPHLKRLAGRRLASAPRGRALDTTELVHETYLRLLGQRRIPWQDRAHLFAIAARLMRRALLDATRFEGRAKRGGYRPAVSLDEVTIAAAGIDVDAVALDQTLERLHAVDPRAARVVELRFFAGMSFDEIAEALAIGRATAARAWRFARSWLHLHLAPTSAPEGDGAS